MKKGRASFCVFKIMAGKTKASEVEVEEDPHILALTLQIERIIEELDPMVLETFRNNPAKVAEWKKIMRCCLSRFV